MEEDPSDDGQEVYLDEAEYQNLNLGLIKDMNPMVKNALGLGFLAIIFFFLIMGIMSLMKKPDEKKKKKKN